MSLIFILAVSALPATGSHEAFPYDVRPTALIRGSSEDQAVVVEIRAASAAAASTTIQVTAGDNLIFEGKAAAAGVGRPLWIDVPVPRNGTHAKIDVRMKENASRVLTFDIPVPGDGWTLHFVAGFHFDPVWWNTQAHYTETGYRLGETVGPGLTLMHEYLRICREDPDYRVAFHQLPYLKTFVEAYPDAVGELLERIADKRCSIVGGTYNELSSTLISSESSIRNAIYGSLFQRQILDGDGAIWWQCDVFGHDPSFPGLMHGTGHDAGAFARGPFHQWGAPRDRVNFPSEFLWMSPDGASVLTHYMTAHYGYAYQQLATGMNSASADNHSTRRIIADMFEDLKRPALTRNVLLPMHMDFIRPLKNLGGVVRDWNRTFHSPKARISTPEQFFGAVREQIAEDKIVVPVITRDMNPIYTGCAVSFADLKTANRASETALRDAEIMATMASWHGAPYPALAIDRAWRQLLFNAHHDAVTGSMSDQVYLDVLYAYRDAIEIAEKVIEGAQAFLGRHHGFGGGQTAIWNTTGRQRRAVIHDNGGDRKAVTVPPFGCRIIQEAEAVSGTRRSATILENEYLLVTVDLEKGGTVASLIDKESRRELLRGPGNDIVVCEEYESLPGHGEGPWHIATTGKRMGGTNHAAEIIESGSDDYSILIEAGNPQFTKRQLYTLYPGERMLRIRTEILRWRGKNKLLRAEFPFQLPGTRPLHQTASAVIGRPFARDVDTAEDAWTLDQAFHQWVALGHAATISVFDSDSRVHRRAVGVGEIILPQDPSGTQIAIANRLATSLVSAGVTTTTTTADRRRYGDLEYDSNLPDFRALVFVDQEVPESLLREFEAGGISAGARFVDSASQATLLFTDVNQIEEACTTLASDGEIRVPFHEAEIGLADDLVDGGVALLSRGPVSTHIAPDGTMSLNLMRSCTSWPAGVWIDKPSRRLPDGEPLETMHGSHSFEYAVVPFAGSYRDALLSQIAHEYQHPPSVVRASAPSGKPGSFIAESLLRVAPADVLVRALKPAGFPEARWQTPTRNVTTSTARRTVIRLWNGSGRNVVARVFFERLAGRAWRADLLEKPREQLKVNGKTILLEMGPHAVETIICETAVDPLIPDAAYDPVAEDRAVSAYWLENLGEGVTGNGVVSLSPSARRVKTVDGTATFDLHVANNHVTESIDVRLSALSPEYLDVEFSDDMLFLPPAAFKTVKVTVKNRQSGVEPGSEAFVGIDAVTSFTWKVESGVWIGSEDRPDSTLTVQSLTPAIGPDGVAGVEIKNTTGGPIRGRLTWISPFELWPALDDWRREVVVAPRSQTTVDATLHGAVDSFIIPRFTYAGRVTYGEAIWVSTQPGRSALSCDLQRLRVTDNGRGLLTFRAISVSGLAPDANLELHAPEGWSFREKSRSFRDNGGGRELLIEYEVVARDLAEGGPIRGTIEGGGQATIDARRVPVQSALNTAANVVIDGRLDEWMDSEFTDVSDELATVRAAVRHGPRGVVFGLAVDDAEFFQPYFGASIWRGDSIQLGISTAPATETGFQEHDYEFGAALTPEGALVWSWIAGIGGQTGIIKDADVSIRHEHGKTVYEILLPTSALPPANWRAGSSFGFSYIANDNDGDGFRGATQWTPGISGVKDPSLFGVLSLK